MLRNLTNIVDHRKNPYIWQKVWAVVEPTFADNRMDGADQAAAPAPDAPLVDYAPGSMTLLDAVNWADSFHGPITLYLYDSDPG